ncbi:SPOR domain-containing protein [Dyadobacter sp. CY323]|uniref:HU domain-containing protein n=1 Tax=Dyadobacter sp. CY323 TaxID=2907302 RepID=UPI001F33C54F|nr:SPOR domain-containing protein [Dyadobacter sp. CY323]MCE6992173.1 SPOR domain-containing protein [Dyadobacter sp. CY323]
MIAVETVIRKLVGEYEFVIIPGFGALLSHQIHASYDSNSGFFSPPVKKLAFNEYLKLDDGLLANYISRHENLSHLEAVEYVKKYTESLRNELEAEGRAGISGIGEFNKNVEGKLVFEPNNDKCFKDDWYGFEKVKVRTFNNKVSTAIASESYANEDVEVLELPDNYKRKPVKWVGWAAAAVFIGLLCGLSFFVVNSSESEIRSTLNPFTELFKSKPAEVADKVVLKEPVIAQKEVAPTSNVEPTITEVDSVVVNSVTTSNAAEVLPEKGSAAVTSVPETKAVPATDGNFYVIAGAFKGQKQANVLLADLNKKGFNDAFIIPANKYSRKVKVAISAYESEREAYRASARLKEVIGEAGWVLEKK